MRVVLGLGLACLVFAVWHTWQISRCSSWPRADAKVSKLLISYHTNVLGHNKLTPISVSENIDFLYVYEVNGRQFESRRFFYLPGYPRSYELRRRYPEGARFLAFYNPDAPSTAIVEPESINYPAFGVAFGLLSIWGLVFGAKRRQVRKSRANQEVPTTPTPPRS